MGLEESLSKSADVKPWNNVRNTMAPNPSPEELAQEYYKAASVWTTPIRPKKSEEDVERVLAVKPSTPSVRLSKAGARQDSRNKGHFAFGHYSGYDVCFDLYIPKSKGNPQKIDFWFPTQAVQNSLGKLMVALVENGYVISRLNYYRDADFFKAI